MSYSQNFEDVMLWRALGSIGNGFYIDVGAQDPVVDSVTKAFYERGWRGINIEPVQCFFDALSEDRPEDINLQLAATSREGEIHFFEVVDTGLSTTNERIANEHRSAGLEIVEYQVPGKRLDDICRDHHVGEINFLKVDAEGAEADVIKGLDLGTIRPWIIVVESTYPNSQESSHEEWEDLILPEGYSMVFFDGLNRFFLAAEHQNLSPFFRTPPNVFDEFVLYAHWRADKRAQKFERDLLQSRNLLEQKTAELEKVRSSLSWRLTKPLRKLKTALILLFRHGASDEPPTPLG